VPGRFITFEGIDGAGKSTHIEAVAAHLREGGHPVLSTREPGGTELAESLRSLILHAPMDALTETLLIFAARRDHVTTVIAPSLARGETVLCDRFTDATFAYQGAGRGFDAAVLAQLETWVQDGLQPDLTVWFDLDPSVAAQRLVGARVPDKFESQPQEFFARVSGGYAARMQADPKRFLRVDAEQSRQQVWHDVQAGVRARGLLP
jgi:dTMP kinase